MSVYDIAYTFPSSLEKGDVLNCTYTRQFKTITLPSGSYKLECWGAQGGDTSSHYGGKGGYSTGKLTLTKEASLFLYVGGQGEIASDGQVNGGFNGGGAALADSSSRTPCSGGGASDIRIDVDSLHARVIIAGGGGGAYRRSTLRADGGNGGGLSGGDGESTWWGKNQGGVGGNQTSGGTSYNQSESNPSIGVLSNFGIGGEVSSQAEFSGGGGGWYGGGFAYRAGAGGGSGFVYTSSNYQNYPSGCLLSSASYLESAETNGGDSSFLSPSGSQEQGHSGNGYIRITILEISSSPPPVVQDSLNVFTKINNSIVKGEKIFVKVDNKWLQGEKIYSKINGIWK